MTKVLETFKLTKMFNGLTAVDSLEISVEAGENFGLLGPKSAGKNHHKLEATHNSETYFGNCKS